MTMLIDITRVDGSVLRLPLDAPNLSSLHAQPGARIRVIDTATGNALPAQALAREGDALLVHRADGNAPLRIHGVFDGWPESTQPVFEGPQAAAPAAETVASSTAGPAPVAPSPAPVTTVAAAEGASAASGAADGSAGGFGVSGNALFGGVAALGVALAASGGGASSAAVPAPAPPPAPPPDTTAPAAPTIGPIAGDGIVNAAEAGAGIVIAGTAEAGSTVAIRWSDGATTVRASAVADASGHYSATINPTGLVDGATNVSATATDAAGNTSAATTSAVTLDRVAPSAPSATLATGSDSGVSGDNITNDTTPTLSGTAESGATITLSYTDAGGTARTETGTADGSGNWSLTLAHALAGTGAALPISIRATDGAGNVSSATNLSLTIDDQVQAPSLRINPNDGSVSGFSEPGASIALDHDGNPGTAALTSTADGSGAYAFVAGTVANAGQTVSAVATDVAGNVSAASSLTMLAGGSAGADTLSNAGNPAATLTGLAGDDSLTAGNNGDRLDGGAGADTLIGGLGNDILIGGSGADNISGGDGADVILGGAGGSVRNYQFDFWDASVANSIDSATPAGTPVADSYTGFRGSASLGWTELTTPDVRAISDGHGAQINVQTGGLVEFIGTANVANNGPDLTGTGGALYWETEFTGSDGANGLSQSTTTSSGESYTLSLQTSSFDGDTSYSVVWNSQEIAFYNGYTNTWSGQQPGITPISPGDPSILRQTLSFTVDGNPSGADSTLALRAWAPLNQDGGDGLQIDRVTLTSTPDSGDTIDGGNGNDLIFGQGGDDTLTGGSGADTFVYSMQAHNHDDVITDFVVGVDRILLVDAIDADRSGSLGPIDTPSSVTNLNAADFLVSGVGGQLVTLGDNGGNLQLGFYGENNAGLGSVTLQGISSASYSTVGDLFAAGILVATQDGFHTGL